MGGVIGSRVGREADSGVLRILWAGAYAAIIGAALITIGALWLWLASDAGSDAGLGLLLKLVSAASVVLTALSLLGLYALLVEVRSPAGIMWGLAGALISLLSILALILMVARPNPLSAPEAAGEGTLLAFAALIVVWIRPIGIMTFGVAAMVADFRGPWEYVLFAIGLLESPLPALALRYLPGPAGVGGWTALAFGMPGVHSGVVAALAWVVFGGALFASGHALQRRRRPTYDLGR